mgnify:FL=1
MTTRIAVAGTGFFSQFHYDAWGRLDVEVVGICSLDAESAAAVAAQFPGCRVFDDFAAMIAATRPDLIDIVTPPPTHLDFIRIALAVGIPVICQKPFCGGLDGATEAAAQTGVPLIVHENFRYMPWYAEIKRALDAGSLGTLYQGTFRLRPGDGQGPEAYLARQPYFQNMPRFLVHETLVHIIDVFRYLLGEPDYVLADLRRLNPAIKGEDAGVVVLGFTGGVRALIDGNRLVDHAAENRRLTMGEMWLEGADAVLRLDGDGALHHRLHGENTETPLSYDWQNIGYGGDCVYLLCADALAALSEGRTPANTADQYLTNLRIVDAVYRSAEEGRRVDF